MDQALRNRLRNTVSRCRVLLEEAVGNTLEGHFGVRADGEVEDDSRLTHLSPEELERRERVVSHLRHIQAGGHKPADAVTRLVREVSYTHLNRLCAYKMLERRGLIREAVGRGPSSNGFMFYLADHPEQERLYASGHQSEAYQNFLVWLGGELSGEIGVLFSPEDPASSLFPPQRVLNSVLEEINAEEISPAWDEEEAIGWVYQYYTPREQREEARKASQAPRDSYELSFRNQFYTPRYVVQFLADNTLGRLWHEMRGGETDLKEHCVYMVRQPDEVFLSSLTSGEDSSDRRFAEMARGLLTGDESSLREFGSEEMGHERLGSLAACVDGYARHLQEGTDWHQEAWRKIEAADNPEDFSTQDLMDVLFFMERWTHWTGEDEIGSRLAVRIANEIRGRALQIGDPDTETEEPSWRPTFIPYRAPKDPREIRVLDPACGSGHFLLYCFDLLMTIYQEAYESGSAGERLREEYPDREEFRRAVPAMILSHNLHGVDIDLRATQISALVLWLRAQRAYSEMGLGKDERPGIDRVNVVCAEPMPGEEDLLREFAATLDPPLLGQLLEVVFEEARLAGEAGSLLKVEEAVEEAIAKAKARWQREYERDRDSSGNERLLTGREMDRLSGGAGQDSLFDISQITDEEFWERAEGLLLDSLRAYASRAANGGGYERRLFANDAERGFAFVDTFREPFDVVLMNPPFGDASKPSKEYINKHYPRTKNDLYAAFVERGLDLLHPGGYLGAITSRTGFFLTSFRKWREELVLGEARPTAVADLGQGVLDTAMVETAAYVLQKRGQDRR